MSAGDDVGYRCKKVKDAYPASAPNPNAPKRCDQIFTTINRTLYAEMVPVSLWRLKILLKQRLKDLNSPLYPLRMKWLSCWYSGTSWNGYNTAVLILFIVFDAMSSTMEDTSLSWGVDGRGVLTNVVSEECGGEDSSLILLVIFVEDNVDRNRFRRFERKLRHGYCSNRAGPPVRGKSPSIREEITAWIIYCSFTRRWKSILLAPIMVLGQSVRFFLTVLRNRYIWILNLWSNLCLHLKCSLSSGSQIDRRTVKWTKVFPT